MYNGFMHDEDDNPLLNTIAQNIIAKGGIVDVYRIGRGVLGSFKRVELAQGGYRSDPVTSQPLPKLKVRGFWSLHHSRGTEMLINGDFERLEVRKIQPNVFHIIVPE